MLPLNLNPSKTLAPKADATLKKKTTAKRLCSCLARKQRRKTEGKERKTLTVGSLFSWDRMSNQGSGGQSSGEGSHRIRSVRQTELKTSKVFQGESLRTQREHFNCLSWRKSGSCECWLLCVWTDGGRLSRRWLHVARTVKTSLRRETTIDPNRDDRIVAITPLSRTRTCPFSGD